MSQSKGRWYKTGSTDLPCWKKVGVSRDTGPFVYRADGLYYALREREPGPSVLPPFATLKEAKDAADSEYLGKEGDDA